MKQLHTALGLVTFITGAVIMYFYIKVYVFSQVLSEDEKSFELLFKLAGLPIVFIYFTWQTIIYVREKLNKD